MLKSDGTSAEPPFGDEMSHASAPTPPRELGSALKIATAFRLRSETVYMLT